MAIEKIKPNIQSVLSDIELIFFYNLLCKWEASDKKPNCERFDDKNVKEYLKNNFLDLPHTTKKNKYQIIEKSSRNQIQFTSYDGVSVSLIRHLRNAFAHNLIEKGIIEDEEDDDVNNDSADYLHIQDWKNSKCVMDGMIKFVNLEELIKIILK